MQKMMFIPRVGGRMSMSMSKFRPQVAFQHHQMIQRSFGQETWVKPYKLAMFSSKHYDKKHFNGLKPKELEITYFDTQLNPSTATLAEGYDAVCAFVNDDLSSSTLEILKNECGINKIVLRCAGFNNVDLEKAKALDFQIGRVPEYSPYAVAEHAVCLILSLNRRIKRAIDRVRDGNFELDGLLGFDIHGKTVGVIGTGKTGSCFVNIMKGFGANILACDVQKNPLYENDPQVRYTDLEEIYSKSDIISIHSNLHQDTFHLIDKEAIAKMKKGVMIINVARGPILHTHDVIQALKHGHIGYLGIDVVEKEEEIFFADHSSGVISNDNIARLLTFNNVIVTGHQAFFTQEALTNIASVTIQNCFQFAHQRPCSTKIF